MRVSWWKAVEQLRVSMGQFTGAKPKKEEGTNAIWLSPLSMLIVFSVVSWYHWPLMKAWPTRTLTCIPEASP